ncbi:putative zinc-binding protein [Thauera sp. CAU 1555]|uniref:Zinc-binding protein n=1 Tax=Thauera sedimentorum TaxID=2767595 RepID=A0ABR9B7V3_9RHOO|nr:putative zinc-binding protein [Thauera sedimentorum]MBC9071184.1 putative zinc-binding protein [Thauera sedimentorum]MBD8502103.1 putative zinc-binding protein [Thauera sedimentorum]
MTPPASRPARPKPPLVYSCSGCSSAAQLANRLALDLDALGVAEMSCIAGIGGKVPALLKIAHSGRPILALDGCVLACVRETLATEGIVPAEHVRLDLLGVKKRKKTGFDPAQATALLPALADTARRLGAPCAGGRDGDDTA